LILNFFLCHHKLTFCETVKERACHKIMSHAAGSETVIPMDGQTSCKTVRT
jgi:hypothetical protein